VPKSFCTTTIGLGEESSAVDGVSEMDGCGAGDGFVWIESVGRRFARRRFEAGGRSEGEAFRSRDRPVGVLRAGGRKEGDDDGDPVTDIFAAQEGNYNLCCIIPLISLLIDSYADVEICVDDGGDGMADVGEVRWEGQFQFSRRV
jgi:hypothetical protein